MTRKHTNFVALAAVAVVLSANNIPTSHAFIGSASLPASTMTTTTTTTTSTTTLHGLFDRFQSGGSGSSKDSLDEQWEAQQRILQQRNKSPQERQKYFADIEKRREEASKKQKDKWAWQTKNYDKGQDPIDEWKKRRADGTISDLENQYGDPKKIGGIPIPGASFGVGGEFGVGGKFDNGGRFDLRLPYADQGYVDEDADVMGKIGKFFGGGGGGGKSKSKTVESDKSKNNNAKSKGKMGTVSQKKNEPIEKKNKWPWEK